MKLSVIIVNYNVQYFLEQALVSCIRASKGLDIEIIVVDNNSVDGSVKMMKEKFPEITLIANTENTGFSKANNQGIHISKGEYVLLLNPDTVVQENTFREVINFMDSHPDAGGLGVRMIDGQGKFLPESKRGLPTPEVAFYKIFGLSKLFPKSKRFGRYHLGFLDEHKTHEVEILAGAFMLIRKSVLDKIGLLDESFFMYGEDIDLSYRITQAGYKNYYFPETTIIHYKGESTKKTSVNYVFVFYNAMVIFAQKHYSKKNASTFGFLIKAAIWFRATIALAFRFFNKTYQAIFDAIILFLGSLWLKNYWEVNHRFVEGGQYPEEYNFINIPVYVLSWVLGLLISGVYHQRKTLKDIVKGILLGTLFISVFYAFTSENLRFSRALILLGATYGLIFLPLIRIIFNGIKHKNWAVNRQLTYRTIIVGNEKESKRVQNLMHESGVPHQFVGFVGTEQVFNDESNYLGNLAQLEEIIEIYNISEIVFCAKDIPSETIIKIMGETKIEGINYKIVPEESLYIIGSNSKNTNGELYTIEIKYQINNPAEQLNKKIIDLISSIIILVLLPLSFVFIRNPFKAIKNAVWVLLGRMTWVAYIPQGQKDGLPNLRPGILSPADMRKNEAGLSLSPDRLNFFYAKDYKAEIDIQILLKNIRNLGR